MYYMIAFFWIDDQWKIVMMQDVWKNKVNENRISFYELWTIYEEKVRDSIKLLKWKVSEHDHEFMKL